MSQATRVIPQPLGRPLVLAVAALAVGIWAAERSAETGAGHGVAVAGLVCLGAAIAARGRSADAPWWKRLPVRLALVGVALLLADLRVAQRWQIPPERLERQAASGAEIQVAGRLVEDVVAETRTPDEVDTDGRPFLGRVETRVRSVVSVEQWRAADGTMDHPATGLLVVQSDQPLPGCAYGVRVRLSGRFLAPRGVSNPEGLDRARRARRAGESGILFVRPEQVERLADPEPSVRGWLLDVRRHLRAGLVAACGLESSRLARCLVLGERSVLHATELEDFQRSGTVHFLAVSGLNVALVAGCAALLAALTRASPIGQGVAALIGALFYAGVTGLDEPVSRAAVMVAVWLSADLVARRRDGPSGLALAAIVLLLADPFALFDVGFQLSFVSVAAIMVSTLFAPARPTVDPLERLIPPPAWRLVWRDARRGLMGAARISLAAWLGVLPLTAEQFLRVSVWAVPASVLLGPLVALLLTLGLGVAVLGSGGWLVAGLSRILLDLAHGFAGLPGANAAPAPPGVLATMLWYLALGGWAEARRRGDVRWRWGAALAGVACAFAWLWPAPAVPAGTLRATWFDVGHGTMALVEWQGGTLLYDAGGAGDAALVRQVLEPCARRRGVRRIDRLVLSHADMDHVAAVPAALAAFEVGEVWVSPRFNQTALGKEILLRCDRAGVPIRMLARSGTVDLPGGVSAEALWPPPMGPESAGLSDNNGSLVLRLSCAGRSLWLTGDVERAGWERVLRAQDPLPPAEILLAPHHGSVGAWHDGLAERLHPAWVVISTAERFAYAEVVRRWTAAGAQVLCTPLHGAVQATGTAAGWRVETIKHPGDAE